MPDIQSYILDNTIAWIDPTLLKPGRDNPRVTLRTSHPEAFAALKESIRRGIFAPVLVEGGSQEIIGGHQRVDAMRELKMKTVPVLFLKDLTAEEKIRIRIADNGSWGAWDLPQLTLQVESLPADELPLLGLDAPTLDLVAPLDNDAQPAAPDDDQRWATLKFKMTKDAAAIVEGIIEDFCKREKAKPGTALERIVVEWSQSDTSLAA